MSDIIVIVGPTGVGKTKLSIELAKKIDAEIINADSMQVYKDLDIGTAKIKENEKENISHHLFDVVSPKDMYTVFDYQKDARKLINEIRARNKKIIIVGGTGLYIKALLYNYKFNVENKTFKFDEFSNKELLNKIKSIDCKIDIHPNNRKRLERTLTKLYNNPEIDNSGAEKMYSFTMIGLTTDRDNLYEIINNRVDLMIKNGLVLEVKTLYDQNIRSKAISTGIGYKELYKYFDNEITLEEAIELIKKNSRRYAKRQYTFFNNQFDVKWFNTNYENFNITVNEVLRYLNVQ